MFSLFSSFFAPGALFSAFWREVTAFGCAVALAAPIASWFFLDSKAQRSASIRRRNTDVPQATCVLEPESPAPSPSSSPSSSSFPSPPARATKKKKKSVKFDLSRNETVEVEDWYVLTWGTDNSYAGVRWGEQLVWTVDRYLEPYGHTQLHFPETKWIHDVPSWDAENDDGDIEMIDA